jgi:hypothetical protein
MLVSAAIVEAAQKIAGKCTNVPVAARVVLAVTAVSFLAMVLCKSHAVVKNERSTKHV